MELRSMGGGEIGLYQYPKKNDYLVALFLGLILCVLNSSKYSGLSALGNYWFYGFALIINGIGLIYLLRIDFSKKSTFIYILALGFLLFSLLSLIHDYMGKQGLISLMQIYTIFSLSLIVINTRFNFKNMGYITDLILWIFLFLLAVLAVNHFPKLYSGFFTNPNGFGAFIFLLLYFVFISKRSPDAKLVLTGLGMILILFSETRSVLISLMAVLFTYVIWNSLRKRAWLYYGYLTGILTFIGTFVFFYSKMNSIPSFAKINQYVFQLTGKDILSGRDRIWPKLFAAIEKKPLFGYGTGTTPANVMKTELSAHDLYLQTTLQSGIVGMLLLVIVFFIIWHRYRIGESRITRISAAFFVGIIVHQIFEVSLTQNNFSYGMMQWFVILLGMNKYVLKEEAEPCGTEQKTG